MDKSEAIDTINARDRIKTALDVFLSQVAGEVQAKNIGADIHLLAKDYASDMLAEIDGCLDIDELREQVAEPLPRGIPSWRGANG